MRGQALSSGTYTGSEGISFEDLDRRWFLTAAISGAHTLGRAHIDNSGYVGWWSDPENSGIFNNDYYKSILQKGWMPALGIGGNDGVGFSHEPQTCLSSHHHSPTAADLSSCPMHRPPSRPPCVYS